jgi:hypothetical protein
MKLIQRTLALLLPFLILSASFTQVQAAVISNTQLIQQNQHHSDKDNLLQVIQRNDVQQQLLSLGVRSADIEERISSMTQQEIAQLNQQINQLPAGGDALGLIVLIFIVFVITDVIGATDIFPFIHPVK